jgi:hypothetical protein
VRDAKVRTQALLDARRASGGFRVEPPFDRQPGFFKREVQATRPPDAPPPSGRYMALLDFLPNEPWHADLIGKIRNALRRRSGMATTHGVGPRYLHSTGQYHKGGSNTGVFVLLTADDSIATPVPETDYTFSMLKRAQALGDFEALVAAGRDVVHYHLEDPTVNITAELERIVSTVRRQQRRTTR